jgi:hypothetical protein
MCGPKHPYAMSDEKPTRQAGIIVMIATLGLDTGAHSRWP